MNSTAEGATAVEVPEGLTVTPDDPARDGEIWTPDAGVYKLHTVAGSDTAVAYVHVTVTDEEHGVDHITDPLYIPLRQLFVGQAAVDTYTGSTYGKLI